MEKINFGFLGYGLRPHMLFAHMKELGERICAAAVYDPNPEAVNRFLEHVNPDARVYTSDTELINDPDLHWVAVNSWNCFHRPQVLECFRTKKHVFCEKPLAHTLDDCLEMYRAWKQSDSQFIIGFTLRHSPHYVKIQQLVESGAIGEIISFEFNECLPFNHGGYIMADWRSQTRYAGSHMLEKCCHDIDLANQVVTSRAARVASFAGLDFFTPDNQHHMDRLGKSPRGRRAYCDWLEDLDANPFTHQKDIFDNQTVLIEYENGVRATFHTNCNSAIPERRTYICGTEGAIRADVISGKIELARIGFDESIQDVSTGYSGGHGGGDEFLCEDLTSAMLGEKDSEVGFIDALNSALTCLAIDEAAASGNVIDMRPYWQKMEEIS